jgi:Icc-related predicted phosphoesterase
LKEDFDFVLSPGDYCGNERLAKLYFKYAYGKKEEEIPEKIKKEIKKLDKISLNAGIKVVRELKNLKRPIYGIRGNWDPLPWEVDIGSQSVVAGVKKQAIRFARSSRRIIEFIDFKLKNAESFVILGGRSSTSPGKINPSRIKRIKRTLDKKEAIKYIALVKKHYNNRKKRLEDLFKKSIKSGKNIIFLTHNAPYRTKLDKVKKGPARGKHYGSFLEKELIKKYKPQLVICGHMHEHQGVINIGKTKVVAAGPASEGKAAIIELDKNNYKIDNIRFIK